MRSFFMEARVLGPAARLEAVAWEESVVRMQLADIDLIVNATPLGMNPSDPAPIPGRLIAPGAHKEIKAAAVANMNAPGGRAFDQGQSVALPKKVVTFA